MISEGKSIFGVVYEWESMGQRQDVTNPGTAAIPFTNKSAMYQTVYMRR